MNKQKMVLCILISLVMLFGAGKSSEAAPSVSGISGNLSNGSQITISGNGFGTKPQAAPLISSYDHPVGSYNFADEGAGTVAYSASPNIPWYNAYRTTMNRVNSAPLRTGLYQSSIKVSYDPANIGGTDYHPLGYNHDLADRYAYISWWMYRDYSTWNQWSTSGANTKFFRLWTGQTNPRLMTAFAHRTDALGNPDCLSDGGDGLGSYYDGTGIFGYGWNIDYSACGAVAYMRGMYSPTTGNSSCMGMLKEWEHWELFYDLGTNFAASTPGTDGRAIIFKNGKTIADTSHIQWSQTGELNTNRIYLVGQVTGGRTVTGGNEYLDQVYIDNSMSHVFLSDKSDLTNWARNSSAYHSEIQVPSNWSNNSLTFTLNQGSFTNGQQAYLYVVDANGNINSSGYPITIGASGEDTIAPSAPGGLMVK